MEEKSESTYYFQNIESKYERDDATEQREENVSNFDELKDECFDTDVKMEQTVIIDNDRAENSPHCKWVCESCGKTFKHRIGLLHHHKNKCSVQRIHKCTKCEFECISSALLKAHRSKVHSIVHVCPICDYKNRRAIEVKLHLAEKHGVRNIQCKECKFTCATEKMLLRHLKKSHGDKLEEGGPAGGRTVLKHLARLSLVTEALNTLEDEIDDKTKMLLERYEAK